MHIARDFTDGQQQRISVYDVESNLNGFRVTHTACLSTAIKSVRVYTGSGPRSVS